MIWFFIALAVIFIFGMVLANSTKKTDNYGTEYGIKESGRFDSSRAIKHQFVGRFPTQHEARTVCDDLNQNGDKMYVEGRQIFCDGRIDIAQVREAMGCLHDDYYSTH